MNDNLLNILKEKPIIIPRLLFKNYKKLNITDEEFIVLIYILNIGEKLPYNPELFLKDLAIDKYKVMELINNLSEKNIITIKIEKNKNNRREEYIYTDLLYDKLINLVLNQENTIDSNFDEVFTSFEKEFGRTISPMEYELIKSWINDKIPKELIIEALKEATYNGVSNMRYIEKILTEWQKKGIKTKEDVVKDKNNFKNNKKKEIEVYDYNWLEDE
jgi:DNA replication protein